MTAQTGRIPAQVAARRVSVAAPALLFLLALLVFLLHNPLQRDLTEDPGIFTYLSHLVARGLAPHRDAFNEQSSLAFILGGGSMWLGERVGLHPLLALRALSLMVGAAVVVMTFEVGYVFMRRRGAAFIGGLIMLGFTGYGARVATALEPKSLMLLLGLGALYALSCRRWIWAGALGMGAGLAWQIGWLYLGIALLLAILQGGGNWSARARAAAALALGALAAFAVYALFFVSRGALVEMLQQTFIAPLFMHHPAERGWERRLPQLYRTFAKGFPLHLPFVGFAFAGCGVMAAAYLRPWEPRRALRRLLYFLFRNRRTAGVLLASLSFSIFALLDFQNYPDWFSLLPFIAIFAAWFIGWIWDRVARRLERWRLWDTRVQWGAFIALALVVLALGIAPPLTPEAQTRATRRGSWQAQQRAAAELNARLPRDAPLWLLDQSELLFFMQRGNLNKYVYLFGDADAAVEQFERGGFDGMLAEVRAAEPLLLSFARLKRREFARGENFVQLLELPQSYVPLKACRALGRGEFYVRADRAEELFPIGASSCLAR